MKGAIAAAGIALASTALVTPAVRALAFRIGAVDLPGARRVHRRPIARLGGVAVLAGFFLSLAILGTTHSSAAGRFFIEPQRFFGLLVGSCLVCLLGIWDDVRGARPRYKLAIQSAAATIAFASGFRIDAVHLPILGDIHFHWAAAPLTIFWFVAVMNALNLIDGLDGLASGIAFFACVSNFAIAYVSDNSVVLLLSAGLGGAIFGFLLYNFNPASIFLGDSGSLFLGFVLAAMSLLGTSMKSSTAVSILVPIIALGVPITDTLLAMVRRFLARRPIFSADREHIHHRLLDLGIDHRSAVLTLYGISILLAVSAIALALGSGWEVGGALVVVSVVLFGMVRTAGRFAGARTVGQRQTRLDATTVEALRRATVDAVQAIGHASTRMELEAALAALAGIPLLESARVQLRVDAVAQALAAEGDANARDWLAFDLGGPDSARCLRFMLANDVSPDWPELRVPLELVAVATQARLGLFEDGG